jgi:isoleucyl-tRNA synthetase
MDGVVEAQRKFFGTLYNTYSFFAIYANLDQFEFDANNLIPLENRTELDRWILSRLNSLILAVQQSLDDYDPTTAGREIEDFVNEHLSNWYVRLSRRRFWKSQMNDDKKAAYETLYECLETVSKLMCSISPFFADWLYQSLNYKATAGKKAVSVHLTNFPEANAAAIDVELEETMGIAENLCSLVFSLRKKEKLKVRQPLQKMMVPVLSAKFAKELLHIEGLIKSEVNVKEIEQIDANNNLIVKRIKPNFKTLGPKLGQEMKAIAGLVSQFSQDQIRQIETLGYIYTDLGSRQFKLELEDVEISTADMPGWTVASDKGMTVALDITLTPELVLEGLARELVNRVQNMRKDSGFELTDRIIVTYDGDEDIQNCIKIHMAYICSEILADEVVYLQNLETEILELNDKAVKIKITKV